MQKSEPQLLKTEDREHSSDKAQLLGEEREDTGFGDDTAEYLKQCNILVNIITVVCLMILLSVTISFSPFFFVLGNFGVCFLSSYIRIIKEIGKRNYNLNTILNWVFRLQAAMIALHFPPTCL